MVFDAAGRRLPPPTSALLQVFIENVPVEFQQARAGNSAHLEIAGAFGCRQLADGFAAQRLILGAMAHQHPPVHQRVQFHAARHANGDHPTAGDLFLLPVNHHRRTTLRQRLPQSIFRVIRGEAAVGSAIQTDTHHHYAAIGIGKRHQRLCQHVGISVGKESNGLIRTLFQQCIEHRSILTQVPGMQNFRDLEIPSVCVTLPATTILM